MLRSESEKWRALLRFLNESKLDRVDWDPSSGSVRMTFRCLRHDAFGASFYDEPIELTFSGVEAIAIAHEPVFLGVRPSRYVSPRWMEAGDLRRWTFPPKEVEVSVNSARVEEDVLLAHRTEWAFGNESDLDRSGLRLVLSFRATAVPGSPESQVNLLFAGQAIRASRGGDELAAYEWEDQLRSCEDRFIPLARDLEPGLTYRPPAEPPFELEPTDAPAELLAPIKDWFESLHDRDWLRRAASCQSLNLSTEELARNEERHFMASFGWWGYARQVDGWWVEGRVGEVTVRGVEHTVPDEVDPAEDTESVWTFLLRRRGDRWVIRRWIQGWPAYRSAEKRPGREKPWHLWWASGGIIA